MKQEEKHVISGTDFANDDATKPISHSSNSAMIIDFQAKS